MEGSAQQPPVPSGVEDEVAALRERFALIDEVDQRTAEMVERLAGVMRGSAEVRAQASLEIAAGLQALEWRVAEDRARQLDAMRALQQGLADAQERMREVVHAVATLGTQVSDLHARANPETAGAPAPAPAPLPAAQPWHVTVAGLGSATRALALQRHLAGLPGVVAVTTRAFDGGTARFELSVRGEPPVEELLAWPEGGLSVTDAAEGELHVLAERGDPS